MIFFSLLSAKDSGGYHLQSRTAPFSGCSGFAVPKRQMPDITLKN
jgi:hypothetical protein